MNESDTPPTPPGAPGGHDDLVEAAGQPIGAGTVKPEYDPRLANEDLAPLREQSWSSYNIFAFWMSDVHSVGGYVTAGSLFALGLTSWQVLVALLVGITIVYFFCNLVARPSQQGAVPYPVVCRASFGVLGANVPAIIRGLIAVAWYGIQTYLASAALDVVLLKLFDGLTPYADVHQYGFLGLPLVMPDRFDRWNGRPSSPMEAATRGRLRDHFGSHDRSLAELLGREPAWLT